MPPAGSTTSGLKSLAASRAVFPDRRSLLDERRHSFAAVWCNGVAGDCLRHQPVRLALCLFHLPVETLLTDGERVATELCELVDQGHDLGIQPLERDGAVDQTPPLSRRGIYKSACQEHLHRVLAADVAGHRHARCRAEQPVANTGGREAAVIAGDG